MDNGLLANPVIYVIDKNLIMKKNWGPVEQLLQGGNTTTCGLCPTRRLLEPLFRAH